MPQQAAVNPLVQLFPLLLIFVIFYFLLIRPQKQKEKEHQKMLTGIAKNDEVVTFGGIHGTVVNVKEKTLILRIDENVKMEIEKNSISYIKNPKNA
ncbi:MAG: preprotein translocase subunit YajC [Candidatus Omnitrophica bacterium]|nr:preprotein translocase subunit YajC [Candidatus Omnitrophota bacterium]MDD5771004.1 preprotein translocase subunit YajC [Candidatus Omnitrophota bacterium]